MGSLGAETPSAGIYMVTVLPQGCTSWEFRLGEAGEVVAMDNATYQALQVIAHDDLEEDIAWWKSQFIPPIKGRGLAVSC